MSDATVSNAYTSMGNNADISSASLENKPISKFALFGQKGLTASRIPMYLLSAVINFFILTFIFVATLYTKLKALYQAGDQGQVSYTKNAFLRGIGLALIAAVIIFIIDIISGGFASLLMIPVYVFAGIATLVLSLIAPTFLQDVTETKNGIEVSHISGYKLWSVSFWPIFTVGMLIALALGAFSTYIGNKLSGIILNTINSITNKGLTGTDFRSIFQLI